MKELYIKNGTCFIDGKWVKTNLLVRDGKIANIGYSGVVTADVFDAEGLKIIPGIIDPHVHMALSCGDNTSADDFDKGTISAALGGVTTIVDFLDPTRNAEALETSFSDRLELAKHSHIDYHLHGCICEPDGDLEAYVKTMKKLGINTIKLFTTYSETRRRTYDEDIIELLKLSAKYKFLVVAHIERDEDIIVKPDMKCTDIDVSRPSSCEISEVGMLCSFAQQTNGYLYIVHCSSGLTVRKLAAKFGDILGKHVFVESCPQYFYLNNKALKGEKGYLYTFAPPLRSEQEQKELIANFKYVNTIGTDHCPFMEEDKASHPMLVGHPFGIGGIETSFLLMHKLFGDSVIDKMTKNVADLEGFSQKGSISKGLDADLVFFKKTDPYKIGKPHGHADYSVYEGIELNEKIIHTMQRGEFIVKNGEFIGGKGQLLNCDKEADYD